MLKDFTISNIGEISNEGKHYYSACILLFIFANIDNHVWLL